MEEPISGSFRKNNLYGILGLVSGLALMGLFLFLMQVDNQAGTELLTPVILGAVVVVCSVISLLFNCKAYFRVQDGQIEAAYHWFGRLHLPVSRLSFVQHRINTLILQCDNGKCYTIMGMENSLDMSTKLRKQIFQMEQEAPEALLEQLEKAKERRKKGIYWVCGGVVLLFANIFLTVFLTGGREMFQFTQTDWIIFTGMGVWELISLVATFWAANRCGKQVLPIEQLTHRFMGAVVATQPLPPGNLKAVYTDGHYSGRFSVYGFPNESKAYFCVEEFAGDFALHTVYTSKIYENEESLPQETLAVLIDVTPYYT